MKIFLDSEFTKLDKDGELISLGLVTEDNREFYAEFNDYDENQIDDWLQENVINNLVFKDVLIELNGRDTYAHYDVSLLSIPKSKKVTIKSCKHTIGEYIKKFLEIYKDVEIWSDCLAYDCMLFCNIFGGALKIPNNIYYIPFDIATLMKIKGVDPDINREEFINNSVKGNKHNALYDAKVIKACYEKLMEM